MTTYRTGNPIGSTDPRDLYDNAENLDTAVNDLSRDTWSDRLGRSRKTMSGMDREFNADQASRDNRVNTFITSSRYQFLGDYAAGIEITEYYQIVRDSDGEFWRLSGQVELPYTTTGAGLPEDDSLTPLGDAVLRQQLDDINQGAAMLGRGVVAVDSIADLLSLPAGQRKESLRYLVKEYYAGTGVGGGEFYWDSVSDEDADGCIIFGEGSGRFLRTGITSISPAMAGAKGAPNDDTPYFQAACDAAVRLKVPLVFTTQHYLKPDNTDYTYGVCIYINGDIVIKGLGEGTVFIRGNAHGFHSEGHFVDISGVIFKKTPGTTAGTGGHCIRLSGRIMSPRVE